MTVLLALVFVFLLVSCGDNGSADVTESDVGAVSNAVTDLSVALIRDNASYAYAAENDDVSAALGAYTKERGFMLSEFTAETPDEDSRLEQINTAVTLGADVVVCVGRYMQNAVMTAQNKYPETSFLVVYGEEPDEQNGETFSENTHCITFREEDAGYVAGYIALYEGARSPTFYALSELSVSVHCFGGFAAGVADCAKELGLDGVKIICSMNNDTVLFGDDGPQTGDDGELKLSAYMPSDLFECGADHIVAMGAQVNISEEPSSLNGTMVTPVCFDADDVYGTLTEYPRYNCGPVTVKALERLISSGGTWSVRDAGNCGREGLAEGGIALKTTKYSGRFGDAELEALMEKAQKGEISIPLYEDTADIPSGAVPIVYVGQ